MREQAQPIGPLARIVAVDGDLVEGSWTEPRSRASAAMAPAKSCAAMAGRGLVARFVHGFDQALLLRL